MFHLKLPQAMIAITPTIYVTCPAHM